MRSGLEGFTGGAPADRVRLANNKLVRADAAFVLYWMIAARRSTWSFALDHAVAWSKELRKPLVILEALRVDYPFASDRLHRFALDGMADNTRAFASAPVLYHPYVEVAAGASDDLLDRLSRDAAVVVTDDWPCAPLPQMISRAAVRIGVKVEAIDGNGLLPMSAAPQAYPAAVHFRRFMQRELSRHLMAVPSASPFSRAIPARLSALPTDVVERWPAAAPELLAEAASALTKLPIDHRVPVVSMRGGSVSGGTALRAFVRERLGSYHDRHNHPDDGGTSRLSPYLHFGHVSAHELFEAVMRRERWSISRLGPRPTGTREGWWGVGPGAEAFLDQLVTWRELAISGCAKRPDDYDRFDSLPEWATRTLADHLEDSRPYLYDRCTFERAQTHDALWNAAQGEMLRDGWMHNYMRMLWGKKILEWSETPQEALSTMIALMNRWCLDGRDPNSYAGYMWTLGQYDRPWPERAVYGKVRSMSSVNAAKKVRLVDYLSKTRDCMS
jgi:deoxyribodipyrimidine photo-lyase